MRDDADRWAEEKTLTAAFKTKLADLDRYVPSAPALPSIKRQSRIRWSPSRRETAGPTQWLGIAAAAIGLFFAFALAGSWGFGRLAAAPGESASEVSDVSIEPTATPTNTPEASMEATATPTNTPEASMEATATPTNTPVASPSEAASMNAPVVVRFRPADGGITADTHQPVSVRFSEPMDHRTTEAAFTVIVDGYPLAGDAYWTENDTVLELVPAQPIKVGARVTATVASSAMDVNGKHLASGGSATFAVVGPSVAPIPTGGEATATAPWYADEVYYLNLMNCTRTGGWVTSGGECSSDTNHTLPAQAPLVLDESISDKVARPYARYLADNGILDHYAVHDPNWRLCNWGGLCGSGTWGENLASPGDNMVTVEIYYQNEAFCRCEHYYNIMNPYFHRVGIGVWNSSGTWRIVVEFYD